MTSWDLSDGQHQIKGRIYDHPVDFNGHALLPEAFGDFRNIRGGNLSDLHDIVSPVVTVELRQGDVAVHGLDFLFGHRNMGSEGLEKLDAPSVVHSPVIGDVGNQACIREAPGVVGHDHKQVLWIVLLEGSHNHIFNLFVCQHLFPLAELNHAL